MPDPAALTAFGRPGEDRRRLLAGALLATALHLALLLWGAVARSTTLHLIEPLDPTTAIDIEEWREPAGSGGGEPESEPEPEPAVKPRAAPRPILREKVMVAKEAPAAPRFAPPSVRDLDPEAAREVAVPSSSRRRQRKGSGTGRGVGSGRGGLFGNGALVGNGPGAFRARICFIPESTRTIKSLDSCSAVYEEFIDEINVPTRRFEDGFPGFEDRTEWFSVDITGHFRVSEAGTYLFRLKSDDGSILLVDGHLVVDNDGIHGAVSKRGEIELDEGVHSLRVRYFQGMKYELALQLFVKPPDAPERLFRAAL